LQGRKRTGGGYMRHYRPETEGGDEREHDNMSNRRHQSRSAPRTGGVVTVTAIRSRLSDEDSAFSVSWHSPRGDLCWLSPRIPSQESADAAATVLADFVHAVIAR
jgi:hypothetical protein